MDRFAVRGASKRSLNKDLYLTQRFARHSSPLTTTVYTHVSDEEMYVRLRDLA